MADKSKTKQSKTAQCLARLKAAAKRRNAIAYAAHAPKAIADNPPDSLQPSVLLIDYLNDMGVERYK
jgi:hypothetical protein